MASWLLTNRELPAPAGLTEIASGERFRLFGRDEMGFTASIEGTDVHFYLTGYLLPRIGHGPPASAEPHHLLPALWARHGTWLPHHVKGIFTLLVVSPGVVHLFGDASGFRRSFLWRRGTQFVLSDSLAAITASIETTVDPEAVAAHTLLHHYPEGATFLRSVHSLPPAAHLRYDGELSIERYWSFSELLHRPQSTVTLEEVGDELVRILGGYLSHLQPDGVQLTLTAGKDSRTLLAATLRNGVSPATYTFGDPASSDVVTAQRIARELGLPHANPRPEHLTPDWYEELAWEVVQAGNGLAHLHRAHRLDSVRSQPQLARGRQMLLLGTMGGEGVRGAHLNDLIVTEYVRRSWEGTTPRRQLAQEIFQRYFLRSGPLQHRRLDAMLEALPFFGDDPKRNEFHAMFDLAAAMHHSQDIGLYNRYVSYVVPLFMDIDYLELLFSTRYSMLHRRNTSSNQLDRLDIPEFNCALIRHLNPTLARIPLGSGHTPEDYLRSRLLYILKKGIRKRLMPRRPANFPYGEWFRVFVERQLRAAAESDSWVGELFDLEAALRAVREGPHGSQELYWHRFSNIALHHMLDHTYGSATVPA
jgi:hypothetical protein